MFGRKCLVVAAGLLLAAGAALAQQKAIAIGTGGTGGVYYPLGGGLANVLSKNLPECRRPPKSPAARSTISS